MAGNAASFTQPRLDDTAQRLLYKIALAVQSGALNPQQQTGALGIPGTNAGLLVEHDNSLVSVSAPAAATSDVGFSFIDCSKLVSLSLPVLSISGSVPFNAVLVINCPLFSSFTAGSLTACNANVDFIQLPALTSLDLCSVVSVAVELVVSSCASLSSLNVASFVPTNGLSIDCSACALDVTSVELVLRRCVLAGVTGCTIALDGGTNAGLASLSVQGQADYAILFAGNTVTINP
jgi:hypothetical protein